MTLPRLLARLEVTNAQGLFDSQATTTGDSLTVPRISWTVTKTLDPTANTAEIRIYNLSQETVDLITGTVRVRTEWTALEKLELLSFGASAAPIETIYDNFGLGSVRLAWGYEGANPNTAFPPMSIGFIGGSSNMTVESDGLDSVLVIKAEDAGQLLAAGRLQKSYRAGTDTVDILVDLINAVGIGVDRARLAAAMQSALIARGIPVGKLSQLRGYNAGTAPAAQLIKAVMDGLDLRWSVQDGQFLVLDTNTVLAGYEPIVLSGEAGTLFGNPERLSAQEMRAKTWATAEVRPGREVLVAGAGVTAQYRVDRVQHTGDVYTGGQSTPTLGAIQTIAGVF